MPTASGRPVRAKLIAALMSSDERRINEALSLLEPTFGSVELRSGVFAFTYSDYYRAEMGEGLIKMFCSFAKLIEPGEIVDVKLRAIECEKNLLQASHNTRESTDRAPRSSQENAGQSPTDPQYTARQRPLGRIVNIDPGYVNAAKLVLATTKDCSHRIYIGSGIYGDVELIYKCGSFGCLDWTYLDYRTSQAIDFFNEVRSAYLAQLKVESRD